MKCASATIRLSGLMYGNLTSQSVTYVSGTCVTLDTSLNKGGLGGIFFCPPAYLVNASARPLKISPDPSFQKRGAIGFDGDQEVNEACRALGVS